MSSSPRLWDGSLRKANQWLIELGEELGCQNAAYGLFVLRSVLHTLRDRLPAGEAVHLAAQMPLIIKGLYFEGWQPGSRPVKAHTREEFLALVEKRLRRGIIEPDPAGSTRAVFTLLARRITQREIHDLRGNLPPEIAELWPSASRHSLEREDVGAAVSSV